MLSSVADSLRWIIRWLYDLQLRGAAALIPDRLSSLLSRDMESSLRALAERDGIHGLIDNQLARLDPEDHKVCASFFSAIIRIALMMQYQLRRHILRSPVASAAPPTYKKVFDQDIME